jgi:hypothetical protein
VTPKGPSSVGRAPEPLDYRRALAWGLGLCGGVRTIQLVFEAQALASLLGQAVLVEWGASNIGLTSSDAPVRVVANRIGRGIAIGFAAAALVFGTLVFSRAIEIESVSRFEASILGIGLVTAALQAWRDELLVHGVVLRAFDGTSTPVLTRVLACGMTSAAAALGRHDMTPRTVFVAAELGLVLGALWIWDWDRPERTRFAAPAAYFALRWTADTLFAGGLLHGRLADTSWAGGTAGMLGGTAAVVGLAPLAIFAAVWSAQRISPRSA